METENCVMTLCSPDDVAAKLNIDTLVAVENLGGEIFRTEFHHFEHGDQVWLDEPSSPSDQEVVLEFFNRNPQAFAESSIESFNEMKADDQRYGYQI